MKFRWGDRSLTMIVMGRSAPSRRITRHSKLFLLAFLILSLSLLDEGPVAALEALPGGGGPPSAPAALRLP